MEHQNDVIKLGSSRSGDWGHGGRPGKVGGSTSGPGGRDRRFKSGNVPRGGILSVKPSELNQSFIFKDLNSLDAESLSHLLDTDIETAKFLVRFRKSNEDFDSIDDLLDAASQADAPGLDPAGDVDDDDDDIDVSPVARFDININTATLAQLSLLPGVGPATAQAIIDYRNKNGAFDSLSDLDNVPGIGPSKLEAVSDGISFDSDKFDIDRATIFDRFDALKDATLEGPSFFDNLVGDALERLFHPDAIQDFQDRLIDIGITPHDDRFDDVALSPEFLDSVKDVNTGDINTIINDIVVDGLVDVSEIEDFTNELIESNRVISDPLSDSEIAERVQVFADDLSLESILDDIRGQVNVDIPTGTALGDEFLDRSDIEVTPTDFPPPPVFDFDIPEAEQEKEELLSLVIEKIQPASEFDIDKQEIEKFILDLVPIAEVADGIITAADFVTSLIGNSIEGAAELFNSLFINDDGEIDIVPDPEFDKAAQDSYIQGLLDAGIIELRGTDTVDAITGASLNLSDNDFVLKLGGPGSGHFSHFGTPGSIGGSLPGSRSTEFITPDIAANRINDIIINNGDPCAETIINTGTSMLIIPARGTNCVDVEAMDPLLIELPDLVDGGTLSPTDIVDFAIVGDFPPNDMADLIMAPAVDPISIREHFAPAINPEIVTAVLLAPALDPPTIDLILEELPIDSLDTLIVDLKLSDISTVGIEATAPGRLLDSVVNFFASRVPDVVDPGSVTRFVNNSFDLFLLLLDFDLDISYEELFGLLVPASVSGSSSADVESGNARCSSLLSGLDVSTLDTLSTDELVELLICLFSIDNIAN